MITLYWILGAIALLVIEIATISLVSIWFALGALVAGIVSVLVDSIIIEFAIFILVSVLLLAVTRPIANKYMNGKIEKTNVEAIIGKTFKVATTIDASNGTGMIKINDIEWKARAVEEDTVIPKGTTVIVHKISGVRLIVEEVK